MIECILQGLFLAFILTLFNLDEMFIQVIQPYFAQEILEAHWYLFCILVCILSEILRR